MAFGARAFVDQVTLKVDDRPREDDLRLRLGRVWVEGDLSSRLSYKAEVDFGLGEVAWQDLYLAFDLDRSSRLTVGNIKTVSLENLTSDAVTTFMERGPYNDVLGLGRLMTIEVKTGGEAWTAALALTSDNVNALDAEPREIGLTARATWAPVNANRNHVHLGAWARLRERNDKSLITYQARNNTSLGPAPLSAGPVGEADQTYAVEAAWVRDSFSAQGEWAHTRLDGSTANEDLSAWYGFVSWFPTGESRRYVADEGRFDRPEVLNPLTEGGRGALELGVRYDAADLGDWGGRSSGWTAGATWYATSDIRLMMNYTLAANILPDKTEVEAEGLQFRLQLEY